MKTTEKTQAQHTPGPWIIEQHTAESGPLKGRYSLCAGPATVYQGDPYKCTGEDEANARLIAAAAELLEQLRLVKRYLEMGAPEGVLRDNELAGISAAIAKAGV